MTSPVVLRGMTWNHPRGYDPMVACSARWREETGVAIEWDQRSLQDFESFPVETLARSYDLIVIDHPHVGQITAEGCLAPLDVASREAEREALAAGTVGASYESYRWEGRQWAFPIDAATQVQAWAPDRLAAPLRSWHEVERLAAQGQIALPLRSPHALMVFMSLAANLGTPCGTEPSRPFIDADAGARVYGMMAAIVGGLNPECFAWDPIAALEAMAEENSPIAAIPLLYGYVSYAREGFRPVRILFADAPAAGRAGPTGTVLGGTGIAVSAFSAHREAAIDFAYWIASGEVQRGPYASAGGQPGHAAAWVDDGVNAADGDFYRATRATLEGAWMRARHDGYMAFQAQAAERLANALKGGEEAQALVADLNRMFAASAG